jgi:hypothetical protein
VFYSKTIRDKTAAKQGWQIKKPTKKTHLKKPKNLKMLFCVLDFFLNFLFFMKIIQAFFFETDFL